MKNSKLRGVYLCPVRKLWHPSAFLDFEALHLRAYWLERSIFLKTCTAKSQLTMSQIFGVRFFFTKKLLTEAARKCRKFLAQSVQFHLHQYPTMGAYNRRLDAKSIFFELQPLQKNIRFLAVFWQKLGENEIFVSSVNRPLRLKISQPGICYL